MNLNWDKLRMFHAVAEAGSFTHACNKLNISQSAISRQISSLEDQLGVSLFHRHARGLLLTEQGELLLESTKDVFEKLAIIESKISDTQTEAIGPLKITAPGFLGGGWLAPKINAFHKLYPKLKLTFILDNRIYNLSMREADIALRLYEPQQPDLIKRKLTTINFYICGSKKYIDEHGMPESPRDLQNHRLIGYPNDVPHPHPHTDWIFDLAGLSKDLHQNTLLINSMSAVYATVKYGSGLACLPDFMVAQDKDIVKIMPNYAPPSTDLFFVYPEERRNSKRISVFRNFMLNEINTTKL